MIIKILMLAVVINPMISCAIIKNKPQESKFMKVDGGGYLIRAGRQMEETYGAVVRLKHIPDNAKYIVADFELPNNSGIYERKIFPIDKKKSFVAVNSDPIYGAKYGFYYIKIYLTEDKKAEKIIDSLTQSVKIYTSINKGRDYAKQYTVFLDDKEVKKIIVIYPNNRKKSLLTAEIADGFKMDYAVVSPNESLIEYVPKKETVYNWSKIITIRENKERPGIPNKPSVHIAALGNSLYSKFSKHDKNIQVTYAGIKDGKFFNADNPNFQKLAQDADQIALYIDYKDHERTQYPHQREYLVARMIKSDISIWEMQFTVRYDKRWSKQKIESLKKEATDTVASFVPVKVDPILSIKDSAKENGINKFKIESQRLDDRDFNEKFNVVK